MNEKKKRTIIIGSLCGVLLLMVVGYAAFSSLLNINGTSTISSNWHVKITNIVSKNIIGTASNATEPTYNDLSATFKTNLVSPGDSIEYDVTVSNEGNINAKLDKITLTDSNNSAIKFSTSGLKEGDSLNAGDSAVLTVKVEYLESITSQPDDLTSSLTVKLEYSQNKNNENISIDKSAADTLIETSVTAGDGLYQDEYEVGRYIYKGTNPDNYISFNNEIWRIIAVETDGTIKIIKNESIGTLHYDPIYANAITGIKEANTNNGTRHSSLTTDYCHDELYDKLGDKYYGCNIWGSKTTMLDANGNNITQMPREIGGTSYNLPEKEAYINTYLNSTYYNQINETYKNKIDNHLFNVGPVELSAEIATETKQEQNYKWKGKIGLISASDYLKATTNTTCTSIEASNNDPYPCKTNNYLYTSDSWFTLTPYAYFWSGSLIRVIEQGRLTTPGAASSAGYTSGIKPTLYLKSDIELTGEGTKTNPYELSA